MNDMTSHLIQKALDKIIIEGKDYSEFIDEECLSKIMIVTGRVRNNERYYLCIIIKHAIYTQEKNDNYKNYIRGNTCEGLDKTLYTYKDRVAYSLYNKHYSEIMKLNNIDYIDEIENVICALTIIKKILNIEDDDEVMIHELLHNNKKLIFNNNCWEVIDKN
jgi:hypothetical protein